VRIIKVHAGRDGAHVKTIHQVMKYCVGTLNRGMYLKQNMMWDGSPDFESVISGRSDSDYANDMEKRRSVSR
jgi:hypothetical protein